MKQPVCHLCRWTPVPHVPYWECDCGAIVDAFGHDGVCSSCKQRIAAVQCPKCAIIKSYSWWIGKEENATNGTVILYAAASSAPAAFQEKAAAWISDRDACFKANPDKGQYWFESYYEGRASDEELDSVIAQVAAGNGFSLAHPVKDVGIAPIEPALFLLGVTITDRWVPMEGITDTGVTDEYTVQTESGAIFHFYHFLRQDQF